MNITNLAQLKKYLQFGVSLTMTYCSYTRPNNSNTLVGTTRKINLVQSNAIRLEPLPWQDGQGSWLSYDKASSYIFDNDGFSVIDKDDNNSIVLTYKY